MKLGAAGLAGLAGLAAAGVASAALAHHSVAGQFDVSQPTTWTGVITEIDWINPHIYIHLEVADEAGAVTTWMLETAPPAMMRRGGLTKEMMLGDGAPVTIDGIPARLEDRNMGFIYRITYADGHFYQLSADR
jgi:hypothetical protein